MSSVVVIGSINIDESVQVAHLPGPGETISARDAATELGGKGANQAVAAARAGADVRMVGAIGAADSSALLDSLEVEGIDASALTQLSGVSSGRALVLVGDDSENSIVVIPGANRSIPDDLVESACSTLATGDVVLLQHEIPARTSRLAASRAYWAGARVIWNAAPAPESLDELIQEVDLLVVNQHELAAIVSLLGATASAGDPEADVLLVSNQLDTDVVCTLGAAGAIAVFGKSVTRYDAPAVDAVDTTAAGDTFVGYLAAGMARGEDSATLLHRASLAGALTVTRRGASSSIPLLHEVTEHLSPDVRTTA